jgi:hypothetical protein
MQAIVECPPLAEALFDIDVMKRSVKLSNSNYYGMVTVNDLVEILRSNSIPVEQVETIARGMGDKEVVFTSPLPFDFLIKND